MILEFMADKLEEKGVGVVGQNIFIGELPLNTGSGILLVPMLSTANRDLPMLRTQLFQVTCRYNSYPESYAKAEQVYLSLVLNQSSNGLVHVDSCRPFTQPMHFGRSEGIWIFGVNFEAIWKGL